MPGGSEEFPHHPVAGSAAETGLRGQVLLGLGGGGGGGTHSIHSCAIGPAL